jgi:hypothetical protein
VCWKPCSSCWSFHLLREEFLSAPIHSPPLWFAVSVLQRPAKGTDHPRQPCGPSVAPGVRHMFLLFVSTRHFDPREFKGFVAWSSRTVRVQVTNSPRWSRTVHESRSDRPRAPCRGGCFCLFFQTVRLEVPDRSRAGRTI